MASGSLMRGFAGTAGIAVIVSACSAPSPSATVDVAIGCTPSASWTFPETAIGQTASAFLLVTAVTSGATNVELDGPDAAEFRVVPESSTCGPSLEAGDTCVVLVELAPSAAGVRHASLYIGGTVLPLVGPAIAAPSGLVATLRSADSVGGFYDLASNHSLLLVNQGATDAVLGTGTFTGLDLLVSATHDCPATLAPGAACTISFAVNPYGNRGNGLACAATSYRLPSNLNTVEVSISRMFLGGVALALHGTGIGHVVSSPPGIDCARDPALDVQTGRCQHAFYEPVTLTATPAPDHHFNGWTDAACGYLPTCVVAPGSQLSEVGATFLSPSSRAIDVTFAGSAPGKVTGAVTCTSSCSGWAESGARASLVAHTPSRFTWGGACSGVTKQACDLGVVVNDRVVTVTFTPDDHAVASFFAVSGIGAVAPDGDLIVAQVHITRLSPTGTVRWMTTQAASCTSLKTTSLGETYCLDAAGILIKIDADGAVAWQRSIPPPNKAAKKSVIAVAANDDVAVVDQDPAGGEVRMYAANGSLRWSAAIPNPVAVAISSTGMTVASGLDGVVRRFDATGARLAGDWTLPPAPGGGSARRQIELELDAQDFLIAQNVYTFGLLQENVFTISRLDPAGGLVFANQIQDSPMMGLGPDQRIGGLARTPNASVSWVSHEYAWGHGFPYLAGFLLETYDAAGARTWMLDKQIVPGYGGAFEGVSILDVSCNKAGRCAVFGSYRELSGAGESWIEVFTLP
ncbi:MAG TPA: PQQ-binding-like beta-propeller repeat protein [Kofleriaceae bacterium]|nr:PQQ-binding-like beta-propeller repeat protein [Kofleriaceae bacterium]